MHKKEGDKKIDIIARTVTEHTGHFEQVYERFIEVDKRFDGIDNRLDSLTLAVINNGERMDRIEENMVTKEDHRQIVCTLDELLRLSLKRDPEMTMMTHTLQRHEKDIEKN